MCCRIILARHVDKRGWEDKAVQGKIIMQVLIICMSNVNMYRKPK
jgi:hypothetical protein